MIDRVQSCLNFIHRAVDELCIDEMSHDPMYQELKDIGLSLSELAIKLIDIRTKLAQNGEM